MILELLLILGQADLPEPIAKPSAETATVSRVIDGDTIELGDDDHTIVRLEGIDCPEHDQPYGLHATKSLERLCLHQDATIKYTGATTYGRKVGTIIVDRIDCNASQIARGWAWIDSRYPSRDTRHADLLATARGQRRGLWRSSSPIAPWEWRRGVRPITSGIPRGRINGDCPHGLCPLNR